MLAASCFAAAQAGAVLSSLIFLLDSCWLSFVVLVATEQIGYYVPCCYGIWLGLRCTVAVRVWLGSSGVFGILGWALCCYKLLQSVGHCCFLGSCGL